ncbi:Uncharacterized protein At4g15970 [Linum perenne]
MNGDNNGHRHAGIKDKLSSYSGRPQFLRRRRSLEVSIAVFLGIAVFCLFLYRSQYYSLRLSPAMWLPRRLFPGSDAANWSEFSSPVMESSDPELIRVLKLAAAPATNQTQPPIPANTLILTTLNSAWAEPGSVLDLFFESFRSGNGTRDLLNHLVIVSLDQKAHRRCTAVHKHCYALTTPAVNFTAEATYMTDEYLVMMWRRIDFLASVLFLGYDIVFTDADIMWFRNPFPHFHQSADFQIACDKYLGSSPLDRRNQPNGGFTFVRSNVRTLQFYRFWYRSRERYPGKHDQDVLNKIKYHPFLDAIELRMRFLDTAHFGGFCEPSRDLNVACTMHANCCVGLEHKIHDLNVVLQDWKHFLSLPSDSRDSRSFTWRAPQRCR